MDQGIISFAPEWSILINHSFKFFNCYLDKIYFKRAGKKQRLTDIQGEKFLEYYINNKNKVFRSNLAQDHIQYLVNNLLIPFIKKCRLFLSDIIFLKIVVQSPNCV